MSEFIEIDLEEGRRYPEDGSAPVSFEDPAAVSIQTGGDDGEQREPGTIARILKTLGVLGAETLEPTLAADPRPPRRRRGKHSKARDDAFAAAQEDLSPSPSELPVYTAKFCLTFSGTKNELAENHACKFAPDTLRDHFSPDVPDLNSPRRFWEDAVNFGSDNVRSTDIIILGASVVGYDNRLPFSCRLKCDEVPRWNALMFKDGARCAMRLPSCSDSQSPFVLGDRRACTRGGFWEQLVVSHLDHMFKIGVVKKESKRRNGEMEGVEDDEDEDVFLVKVDSPLFEEIARGTDDLPSDGEYAAVNVDALSEGCHFVVKRSIGYCTLADLDNGLSFTLFPDSNLEWETTDEGTTLTFEVGINLEIYFSRA